MNRYEGVKCPVCGKTFTAEDEVIVCPVCGTPHHAACYRENGACAHEDWHAEGRKFVLNEPKSEQPHAHTQEDANPGFGGGQQPGGQYGRYSDGRASDVCPRCGNPCDPGAMYCQRCGFPVGQFRARQQQNPYDPRGTASQGAQFMYGGVVSPYAGMNPDEELNEGITVREYAAYIGPASQQYLMRFRRIKEQGRRVSFNLLFGIGNAIYLCYRKLYKVGIPLLVYLGLYLGVYIASMVLTMQSVYSQMSLATAASMDSIYSMMETAMSGIPTWLSNAFVAMRFTMLPIMLIFALFGDKIYFDHCTDRILALKKEHPEAGAAEIAELAGSRGGVNRKITTILITLLLLVLMVVPMMANLILL